MVKAPSITVADISKKYPAEVIQIYQDVKIIDKEKAIIQFYKELVYRTVEEHHPSKIWYSEAECRWKTHIDKTGTKRKLVVRKNKDDLYQVLGEYYGLFDSADRNTLKTLFPAWIQYKSLHTNSTATLRHYKYDWNKYFAGSELVNIPIVELTRLILDEWIHTLIKNEKLTTKQFGNISGLLRQELDYAVERGIIETNPFISVNIKRNMLIRPMKKEAETQVYFSDELDNLLCEAYKVFESTNDTASLAIVLCAKTGIRIGECMALKAEDVENGLIHIHREEIINTPLLPDGSFGPREYLIVDHCKTTAGLRDIPAVQEVEEVVLKIRKENLKRMNTTDYLFIKKDGSKMHAKSVDRKIRTLCSRAGLAPRSAHKLRKTFISTLIDAGMNIDTIRRIAGHKNEMVTLNNYCYGRSKNESIRNDLEQALK